MMYYGAERAALGGATGNADGKLHTKNLAVLQD